MSICVTGDIIVKPDSRVLQNYANDRLPQDFIRRWEAHDPFVFDRHVGKLSLTRF